MGKRGPKPGNYREPVETGEVARPNPMPGMPEGARTVWKRIVSAMPAGYFSPQHYDALRAFCVASYRHSKAVAQLEKLEDGLDLLEDAKVIAQLVGGMLNHWQRVKTAEANIISSQGTKLGIHKNSTWNERHGEPPEKKPKSKRGDLIAIPKRGGGSGE